MNNDNTTKVGDGGYRHVLSIAVPIVLGNAAFTIMQFTDRILLSRYSAEAIQAALPAGVLSFTLVAFFAAIAAYSGTFVSQYHGAGNREGCAKSFASAVILSVLFAPAVLLMLPVCRILMAASGHPPALLEAENTYAFWMVINGIPMSLHWVANGYLVGRGRVVAPTVVTVIGCALNILLDVLLIFGYWGLPRMGIEGAALATFLANVFGLVMLLFVIFFEKEVRELPWRELIRPDWKLIGRIVRFGFPAGLTMFIDCGSFAVFSLMMGRLDPLSLATNNIVLSVNNLAISPLIGLGQATTVLVGQFQGAGKSDFAKKAGWKCLHLGFVYMAAIAVVFFLFDRQILGFFRSPDSPYSIEDMIGLGKLLLFFCICWGMFDTMNVVLSGGLRGAGDTKFVFLSLLIGGWVFWVPAEIITMNYLGGTVVAGWAVMLAFIIAISFVFLWRWCGGKWMQIDLIGEKKSAG